MIYNDSIKVPLVGGYGETHPNQTYTMDEAKIRMQQAEIKGLKWAFENLAGFIAKSKPVKTSGEGE